MANYTPTKAISPSVGRGVFRPDWFFPPLPDVCVLVYFHPCENQFEPPLPDSRHVFDVRSFWTVICFSRRLIYKRVLALIKTM